MHEPDEALNIAFWFSIKAGVEDVSVNRHWVDKIYCLSSINCEVLNP